MKLAYGFAGLAAISAVAAYNLVKIEPVEPLRETHEPKTKEFQAEKLRTCMAMATEGLKSGLGNSPIANSRKPEYQQAGKEFQECMAPRTEDSIILTLGNKSYGLSLK